MAGSAEEDHRGYSHGVNLLQVGDRPILVFSSNGYPPTTSGEEWAHDVFCAWLDPENIDRPIKAKKLVDAPYAQEPASACVNSNGVILVTAEDRQHSEYLDQTFGLWHSNLHEIHAYGEKLMPPQGGHSGHAAASGDKFLVTFCDGWIDGGGVDGNGTGDDIYCRVVYEDGTQGLLMKTSVGKPRDWWPLVAGSDVNWLQVFQRYGKRGIGGGTLYGAITTEKNVAKPIALRKNIKYYNYDVCYVPELARYLVTGTAMDEGGFAILMDTNGEITAKTTGLPETVREARTVTGRVGNARIAVYPTPDTGIAIMELTETSVRFVKTLKGTVEWDYMGTDGMLRTSASGRAEALFAMGTKAGIRFERFDLGDLSDERGTISLRFYDRRGKELSAAAVRKLSNNADAGYDNDALIDPVTMRVAQMNPIYASGTGLSFDALETPKALALNWPTKPHGYSLVVLDNGGKGFSERGTINFTHQAALDTKRRLDEALKARPDYKPSRKFQKAYAIAAENLRAAKDSPKESIRGKLGQLALDQLAAAYDAMLAEYGPAYAQARMNSSVPWIGVTIDTTDNYKRNCDLIAAMANPYGWIRIVFDAGNGPSDYEQMVRYAKSKGLMILGQPVDSFYDKEYTVEQYLERFKAFIRAFPEIDTWEIGNEVNGSWLTDSIAEKVARTADYVHNTAKKKTVLTLFWQINTGSKECALFNWAASNLSPATRQNIDVALISLYPEQAPMGLAFDQVMNQMRAEFPKAQIGIGELGYWEPEQQYWWAYDKSSPNKAARHAVLKQYYNAALGYRGSVGGGFWWDFREQFPRDKAMTDIIRALRDRLGAD
ncbi:MAG: hypothetical protein VB065_03510 [Eubacteriales bacterium]|nr:hypothetical protein [Christensenellaceae bacterium]MEA5065093.1 hypothetical protein [Eubacteriales bacterium]